MKRIKLYLSVIAAMALFILFSINIHAAYNYEEGYSPLNSETTFVDTFVDGADDMVGVILVIAIARSAL